MTQFRNRGLMCYFVFALAGVLVSSIAQAYNREAVVSYALLYSNDSGEYDGNWNEFVYYKYGWDCANFASQCVISGRIKFRSSIEDDDNTREPLLGDTYPELETLRPTRKVIDANTRLYSRTIALANELPGSLLHSRHGLGMLYGFPDLADGGPLWTDVVEGDCCFQLDESGHYIHCMSISEVMRGPGENDLRFSAHDRWRRNHLLSDADAIPNWKQSQYVRVICLPDAPLVQGTPVILSGGDRVKWQWNGLWCAENYQKVAGKADLVLRLHFDTNMNVWAPPAIKLKLGSGEYPFVPWSTDGFMNGWWVWDSTGDFQQYRTWQGRILANGLPDVKHALATISVWAQADDGSGIDKTNEISKYQAGPMECIKILLDTKKGKENLRGNR